MIAWIVISVAVGVVIGLAIAATLNHLTGKAPAPTNAYHGISALGLDANGSGAPEIDPRYVRMVKQVLEQPHPEGKAGFRTLLP
jgi:hypothetical protein